MQSAFAMNRVVRRGVGTYRRGRQRERGVALAIVVWFVAGMSLLVAGIVSHARIDTRMAQLHAARAKVVAAGDGAIQLLLADRLLREDAGANESEGDTLTAEYGLGSTRVLVTAYPAAGFIDLNSAPLKVLAALFFVVGQVSEGDANLLADNVVKWRVGTVGPDNTKISGNQFRAIEDLLRVEGVGRTLFDAVRDFIAVGQSGGTTTNWAVAPEVLMQVLEIANPGQLDAVSRRRENLASAQNKDRTGSAGQGNRPSLAGAFRVDALVSYGDEKWLRRRWVTTGSSADSLLPWKFVRTEPARIYESSYGDH